VALVNPFANTSRSPWAQINGTLPPLIPKPEQQQAPQTIVFAPTHHEAPDLSPLAMIPQGPSRPSVFASMNPEQALRPVLQGAPRPPVWPPPDILSPERSSTTGEIPEEPIQPWLPPARKSVFASTSSRATSDGTIPMIQQAERSSVWAPASGNPDMTPLAMIPQPRQRAAVFASSPVDPLIEAQRHLGGRLEQDYAKDLHPWGTPENHPGFWGKVGHDLNVATGGVNRRGFDEAMLEHRLERLEPVEGEDAERAAATAKTQEDTAEQPGKTASEEAEAGARTDLTTEQAQLYSQAHQAMQDPKIQQAFATLSDPAAAPEARRTAMATISQSPIAALPMLRGEMSGAEQIYRQGETGSRVGGKNIVPDPNSPTGYSTMQYDHYGNPMGMLPVEPSSGSLLGMGPQAGGYIGGQTRLAGGRAGATQAQGLIPIIDPESNEVIGYAPKGGVAGATGAGRTGVAQAEAGGLTPKPGTTVTEQAQNAVSLQNMIEKNILPAIDTAAEAGDMGPANGRVQDFLLRHVGAPDSPAARLQATLDAVPMMLGRMYGYRSAEYAEHLNGFMNARMTPAALKAYLSGVTAHAQTIEHQGGMDKKGAAQEPQAAQPVNQLQRDGKWVNIVVRDGEWVYGDTGKAVQ
jgi:hypothetical protein